MRLHERFQMKPNHNGRTDGRNAVCIPLGVLPPFKSLTSSSSDKCVPEFQFSMARKKWEPWRALEVLVPRGWGQINDVRHWNLP